MRPGCAQTGVSIILTGITSVIFYPKNTKFAVEVPAYQGRLHSKIEANRASRLLSKVSVFVLLFFLLFAQTQKLLLLGNAYFDRAEIWHTCRATKGKYKDQIWDL